MAVCRGSVLDHNKLLRTPYTHATWLQLDISKSSPEIAPKKFDLTVILLLQGKVALQGFCAGEPQNRDVTDVISKVPTKRSKSWSPQDAIFWVHFYFHRNQIALSI